MKAIIGLLIVLQSVYE